MTVFDQTNDCPIIIDSNVTNSVRLAALDLQKNLLRLSGKENGFETTTKKTERGIFIYTKHDKTNFETYNITITSDSISICGTDALGTIYGIYAFATKFLNIPAVYRLANIFPPQRQTLVLENQSFCCKKREVRFRGWFLNDEDLLTDWHISGGKRNIDYPYYQNVMDESVCDMILETALRLELNFIIPSSFLDIANPAEEKLVKAVCRRGMYITQHHIEPMGVSYFAADNYMKKHGFENEEVSFISNRKRMEEIWSFYAKKWAVYSEHVIWQLGLRGKADQAVWKSDPSVPVSMNERAKIITDAIQSQHDILCKTLNTNKFHSTATLWNEGSELYGKGFLKLPENTIPIFSDFGIDQMFSHDFHSAKRESNRNYGIYYHAAFWGMGPHLAEGCNPEKMAYCYRDAKNYNNLYYSVLNISNVRPLHISAMVNSMILQSPNSFNVRESLLKIDCELFGSAGKAVNNLRHAYYNAFADFGEDVLKQAANEWHVYFHAYENLPFTRNAVTDGQLAYMGRYILQNTYFDGLPEPTFEVMRILSESAKKFENLYKKAIETEMLIPKERILYFRQFVKHQILYMKNFTKWCIACKNLTNVSLPSAERKAQGKLAEKNLVEILQDRKILELGEWENWHRGDKKINIPLLLSFTKDAIAQIG